MSAMASPVFKDPVARGAGESRARAGTLSGFAEIRGDFRFRTGVSPAFPAPVFAAAVKVLFSAFAFAGASAAPPEEPKPAAEIFADMKSGGHVILWRHAQTGVRGDEVRNASASAEFLADCRRQRVLDDAGKADATAVGQAARAMGIPVDLVLTSPYCRAKHSAWLAFGADRTRFSSDLQTACFAAAGQVRARRAWLRARLLSPPKSGNIALATHSCNIKSAARDILRWCGMEPTDFRQGDAIVFRPDGGVKLRPVGCLRVGDWKKALAQFQSAGR